MLLQTVLEGLGLGALLVAVCAVGIRKGAVGMVHLYDQKVQERWRCAGSDHKGKNQAKLAALQADLRSGISCLCADFRVCHQRRTDVWSGFWQCFVILSVMNLIDRLGIDGYWVGHTKAWVIPGTEDLMPYISKADKQKKWLFGTVGMAVISLLLAGLGLLL